MKILTLHSDFVKYKPLKKALKNIELSDKEKEGGEAKDALVVMTAVEKRDSNVEDIVSKLINEIKKIADQVGTKNIVLYPYAHLSKDLSSPELAIKVLETAEKKLSKLPDKFKVSRAPFGYYKQFEIKVKGHPLAELSREIVSDSTGKDETIEVVSEEEIKRLVKKLSKVKMSAPRGKNDLKSNVELGRDLDLYIVSDVIGSGLPLLTPKGTAIKREIENFIMDEEIRRGYLYTSTPVMAKSDLYKISGHWQKYKDDMFTLNVGKEEFALRPMTCPFQFALYKRKPRSYKDLPIRYAELANLFRNEQSGELRGLTRLRQFTLADAHIICTENQLEGEFGKVIDLIKFVMETFGIKDIKYRFSRWDPKNKKKYLDKPELWKSTEKNMEKILKKLKIKYDEGIDEASFYGPKLDLQYKDVYGKEDTLITVQLDFSASERFDMTYNDEKNKAQRPMIIHRSSSGATERMMAYLLEKTQGSLPLWLSPIQVKVLTMDNSASDYAKEINDKFIFEGIRVEVDSSNEKIGKKVRKAQIEKANYMLTVGEKEKSNGTVAVRNREGKVEFDVKFENFLEKIKEEIKEKK